MPTTTLTAPAAVEIAAIPGGWTTFDFTLTPQAQEIFKKAVNLVGVSYTPLAFATQVVEGINWCFLAKGAVAVFGAPQLAALLYVYEPLNGAPYLTEIKQIKPGR